MWDNDCLNVYKNCKARHSVFVLLITTKKIYTYVRDLPIHIYMYIYTYRQKDRQTDRHTYVDARMRCMHKCLHCHVCIVSHSLILPIYIYICITLLHIAPALATVAGADILHRDQWEQGQQGERRERRATDSHSEVRCPLRWAFFVWAKLNAWISWGKWGDRPLKYHWRWDLGLGQYQWPCQVQVISDLLEVPCLSSK